LDVKNKNQSMKMQTIVKLKILLSFSYLGISLVNLMNKDGMFFDLKKYALFIVIKEDKR